MPLRVQSDQTTADWRVIALHGLASDRYDLFGLLTELEGEIERVSIEAPWPYLQGFAWFDIEWTDAGIRFDPAQVRESAELLQRSIDGLPPVANTVLMGFSQGGMMALQEVLARPDKYAGAMILSSRWPEPEQLPSRVPPVLVQHGRYDEVIPVSEGQRIRDELRTINDAVVLREYPMGHAVSPDSFDDLQSWLRNLIATTES